MTRAHGVDLSRWDVSFDPDKATGVIDFAIMKASEGTFRDNKFNEIWAGVQKVPIRGAYHYLRSGMNWQGQADFFLSAVRAFDFHFYALDYEVTGNVMDAALADMAHKWIDYVMAKTGKMVLLYTNPAHYDADLFPYGNWMKDYPLWIAQYWRDPTPDKNPALPKNRAPGAWAIYQYASEINFAGHAREYGTPVNSIDLNVFNGTAAEMRTWLKLPPLAQPQPGASPAAQPHAGTVPAAQPQAGAVPAAQPQAGTVPAAQSAAAAKVEMLEWMIAQLTAKKEMLEWMIAQLTAKKNELSGGGPVG
jgi:GH25 family lysozyme M1 (1,4-beta-N-acetylmuramidase)